MLTDPPKLVRQMRVLSLGHEFKEQGKTWALRMDRREEIQQLQGRGAN